MASKASEDFCIASTTSVSGTYKSRKDLCEVIRKLMDPAVIEKPKLTFRYPEAVGGAGAASPAPSLEVSEAEEDTDDETEALRAELETAKETIVAKDAEITALRAKMAIVEAFCAQLAVSAALSP